MVSGISFGQVTNVAPQGQVVAPQTVYYATPQMQADTYVSSTKKKTNPLAKLVVTAAVVLGGSALATKIPAVKKAVEKVAKNPETSKIFDKALNKVNTIGEKVIEVANKGINKVKGIFNKGKSSADIDISGLSEKGQARVKARRAADELNKLKTHNPKDVIILGDGKPKMPELPIGLPTPEQVEATIAKMAK